MNKGDNLISFIIIAVIIWWAYSSYQNNQAKNENTSIMQEHPNYETYKETKDCSSLEPSNSYDEGSGHYAGFQWGAEGNSCNGNSDSFIEGCEDYTTQQAAYDACVSNENK